MKIYFLWLLAAARAQYDPTLAPAPPTYEPTLAPTWTKKPTTAPPTKTPTAPTHYPTSLPTPAPTITPAPSVSFEPTPRPSHAPTPRPTHTPSSMPTTATPTTAVPSPVPSPQPTASFIEVVEIGTAMACIAHVPCLVSWRRRSRVEGPSCGRAAGSTANFSRGPAPLLGGALSAPGPAVALHPQ